MPTDLPEAPPSVGPVAGKYDLIRLIGRGGMGTVWEGRHTTLGNRVAIKFIDSEYADSQEARTRFDNEARAAATIQSKHAIQIYDHGVTDDGKPYIVMELLQGEPLDQRIERFGRLPLQETARILRQVARALTRAHERGIVHRDLKPENIFLVRTPDDDDEVAKVLDFGIAKFKKIDGQSGGVSGGHPSSSTKTGAVLGTPFYMAPEQARGLRDLDHRVDLWAMGVIAYKCVCGVLPFEGVSVGDLLVKICTTPAPIPSSVVPSLGPSFDAWFARALEKEPARRFQSSLELSEGLAYAAGLSTKRASSLSPTSDPLAVPAASNPPGRLGRSSPNATSAPLTASNPRASTSSRGVVIAALGATVVGGALALGGFAILRGKAHAGAQAGLSASMTDVPHATASAPILAAEVAEPKTVAVADAGQTVVDQPDTLHDKGAAQHHRGGGHAGGGKPVAGGGAIPVLPAQGGATVTTAPSQPVVTEPTLPAAAPPVVVQPKPAPTAAPKPASTAIDPGY